MVKRFEVSLDQSGTRSRPRDAKSTRPAVVNSPDEINGNLSTVIITPLSSNKPEISDPRADAVSEERTRDGA